MFKYYKKYNIISIVPLNDTVYLYNNYPLNVKLSKEIISFNYKNQSPFVDGLLFFYKEKQHLYLWFAPRKEYNTLFVIPEAFIIYRVLLEQGNALYCITISDEKKLILYIKNGILLVEFILSDLTQVELLKEQYSITDVVDISYSEYKKIVDIFWKKPIYLLELKQFINIKFSKRNIINFFDKYLYKPIIFMIISYMVINTYQTYTMKNQIQLLTNLYQSFNLKHKDLKEAIKYHNIQINKLNLFFKEELQCYNPLELLISLNGVILKEEDTKIISIQISDLNIKLKIETSENAIKYFNRLSLLKYIDNISIYDTYKKKDNKNIYTYSIQLKVLN